LSYTRMRAPYPLNGRLSSGQRWRLAI